MKRAIAIAPARPATAMATPTGNSDEELLRSVGINTDGPSLLKYFRLRGLGEVKPEHLSALIEQLSDPSPTVARKASSELAALGRRRRSRLCTGRQRSGSGNRR